MRPVLLALVLAAATAARAETTVPIVVVPFGGRCFDAAQLAEHVRAKVGELPVTVGAPARGSRQEVRVSQRAAAIRVEVVARDARGEVVGSARRLVPADVDCATALDVAALIVARAALPLNWRETDRKPPPLGKAMPVPPPHAPPATATVPPTPPVAHAAAPPPSPSPQAAHSPAPPSSSPQAAHSPASPPQASSPQAAHSPAPPPQASPPQAAHSPAAQSPQSQSQSPSPQAAPAPESPPPSPSPSAATKAVRAPTEAGTIVLRTHGPEHRWVGELWADAYGSFGLGRTVDVAGGELAVGFRRGRFGAAARGAIEDDWHSQLQSSAGVIGVQVRRAAVALEAHADVGLRFGALRFSAGPTLPIYIVRPSGVPRPSTSLVPAAPVATVRVLYHIDVGRVFLSAGLACDVAFAREDFTVTGAGVVARTPWVTLGPLIGFGVNM